jgi:hypothetical protein
MIIDQWLEFGKLLVLLEVCKRKFGRLERHRAMRKREFRITFPPTLCVYKQKSGPW